MKGLINKVIEKGIRAGYSKTMIRKEINKLNIHVGVTAFDRRYKAVKQVVGKTLD